MMVPDLSCLVVVILAGFCDMVAGRYRCAAKDFIRLGNSCYFLSSEIVPWQEAHFRCRATQYEDTTLRNYLERPEFAQLGRWIGGMWMVGVDQRWIWAAQGNDIENTRGFATSSVLNLPETDQWNCLYMDPTNRYRWSNENCIRQLHYICEAPLTKVEEESSTTATTMTTTTKTTTEASDSSSIALYDDDDDNENDSEEEDDDEMIDN